MPAPSKKIKLNHYPTRAPKELDKDATKRKTLSIIQELDELQNLLYAAGSHAILVVIQGMDAAGKDGLINDVFSHLNPQGIQVRSFKVPTEEELTHDFLWRVHQETPPKGMIKIFNRSHYEDVLVTRVHGLCDDKLAKKRMKAINDFEDLLQTHAATLILKLYLHVSHEEQQERLQERLVIPRKMWKYNAKDLEESKKWDEYRTYYEAAFEHCNTVPWHIIPSDQNWYKSYLVATLLRDTIKKLKLSYPGLKR